MANQQTEAIGDEWTRLSAEGRTVLEIGAGPGDTAGAAQASLREELARELAPFRGGDGVDLPAGCWMVAA